MRANKRRPIWGGSKGEKQRRSANTNELGIRKTKRITRLGAIRTQTERKKTAYGAKPSAPGRDNSPKGELPRIGENVNERADHPEGGPQKRARKATRKWALLTQVQEVGLAKMGPKRKITRLVGQKKPGEE